MCLKWFKKKKEKILVEVCNSFPDPNGSHPENARVATEWCRPNTHMGQYLKGHGPTQVCSLHAAPPPEPIEKFPIDHPKPAGVPDLVIGVLGIHYESKNYTDKQLKDFALKCSLAGVDYVRVMGDWESEFIPGRGQSAFKRAADNRFDLNQPDPEWDRLLKRLQDILKPYHIGIYFDFFDQCDNAKGPWAFNVNGIGGVLSGEHDARSIYDPTPAALGFFQAFIDRAIGILGIDHVKYGVGNELDGDHTDWMMQVVLPYAEHMLDKGIKLPLCFSGGDMTAHHLHGLLSPDVSHRFGIRDSCLQRHWMPYPADVDKFMSTGSGVRCYAYSDDGVLITNPADQGHCTASGAYAGNKALKIAVVKAMWEWMKPKDPENIIHRLDHVEFLPREISWGEDPTTIAQDELDVYWQMSQEIWGVDIRRKMPE
jgi:hypothetical protein